MSDDANTVRLLFTHRPGPFSWLIQWNTKFRMSHVDVMFPEPIGGAPQMVMGALVPRMRKRTFDDAITGATRYAIATVRNVPDPAGVYDYLFDHEGDHYGYGEILGHTLGFGIDTKYAVCSEAAYRALANGQRRLYEDARPELVTPADLWRQIPRVDKVEFYRAQMWGEWRRSAHDD